MESLFSVVYAESSFFFLDIKKIKIENCSIYFHIYPLKVLTNEKRGGLKVVAFDKSPFKLFTLRFSTKSVQAPSCGRPKITQRTLFLLFESNSWFPITVKCRSFMKKSAKLACHVVNSNIVIDSLPTLQMSHGLLALFEKIYYGDPIFTVISNNGEDVQYRCFN